MTAIALQPTLAYHIRQLFTKTPPQVKPKAQKDTRTVLDYLTTAPSRPPLPIYIKTLWQLLNTAIATGDLDLDTLTDRPSELKKGHLYLSHERVQGLLEDLFAERELSIIHITPTEFYAIMLQLGGKRYAITSEQSIDTTGQGETRISYQLPIATLINLNHVKAQLKEVA